MINTFSQTLKILLSRMKVEGYPKEMTNCPLCNIDLEVDDIRLESHLSDLHGNIVEVAKALANILERLEQIERNIEKSHGPIN